MVAHMEDALDTTNSLHMWLNVDKMFFVILKKIPSPCGFVFKLEAKNVTSRSSSLIPGSTSSSSFDLYISMFPSWQQDENKVLRILGGFFRSTTSVQPHLVRCQITEASLEDNSDEVSSPLLMKSNCNKNMNPMIWP